jgi:hypothetical protein
MPTTQPARKKISRDTAEAIALQALAFLAEDRGRMARFLMLTGLEPEDLRARIGAGELHRAVLEHLAADESLLLVFTANRAIPPESIGAAIALLQAHGP